MRLSSLRFSLAHLFALAMGTGACIGVRAADRTLDHNRFKWHDSSGNLHYSDMLPPEAAKLGYEVVSPQGIVIKRVERAKTPAELAAAKTAEEKAQVERDAASAKTRDDQRLVSGYPEESDLRRAQGQKLEMLRQQVNAAEISLRSQEQTLADLLGRAAEAERSGKPLPAAQATQLAQVRKQVDEQRMAVERRERERDGAADQFEKEIARYRELKGRQNEPQPVQ